MPRASGFMYLGKWAGPDDALEGWWREVGVRVWNVELGGVKRMEKEVGVEVGVRLDLFGWQNARMGSEMCSSEEREAHGAEIAGLR